MAKFKVILEMDRQRPVEIEAFSTEDLRIALMGAVDEIAPGWLNEMGGYAPYFHYEMEENGPWSGLPKRLKKYKKSVEIVMGMSVPYKERFVTLPVEIGRLMRIE